MANVFYFGYTLTNNDLVSYFLNASEEFYDPYYVAYTIFYINSNYNIIIGQEDRVPIRISIGQYRPAFTIPTTWSEGEYCIRWKSKNSATCSSMAQYIQVTSAGSQIPAETVSNIFKENTNK